MSKVTAWSFSRVEMYERCPFQFKCKHIDRLPDPGSPAMERGDKIHKGTAAFLTSDAPLPPEAHRFEQLLNELKAMPATARFVEQQWGFTKAWQPTGWFGKDTWLRVVLDAGVVYEDNTADVIDHKTGKMYNHNSDQVELFAAAVFRRFPTVEHVTTRLWYFDVPEGNELVAEFDKKDVRGIMEKWNARVEPMFAETLWAPRPNDKCKWCAFSKSKGGPCRFG